jgi:hypothetical protein
MRVCDARLVEERQSLLIGISFHNSEQITKKRHQQQLTAVKCEMSMAIMTTKKWLITRP